MPTTPMTNKQLEEKALAKIVFPNPDIMYGYIVVPGVHPTTNETTFDVWRYSWSGGPKGINRPTLIDYWPTYTLALKSIARIADELSKTETF